MSDTTSTLAAISTGGASLLVTEPRAERKRAERATAAARQAERKIADIKAARERRRAIREARVARAEIEVGAQASGTSASSSAVTGAGQVGTQLASNLSFLDETSELARESSIFREKAGRHIRRAGDITAVRDLAIRGASLFAGGS